jgi:hypothetical protein
VTAFQIPDVIIDSEGDQRWSYRGQPAMQLSCGDQWIQRFAPWNGRRAHDLVIVLLVNSTFKKPKRLMFVPWNGPDLAEFFSNFLM